jgi:glucose-6-phosphate dehydrogenase assembly protein OpcA
MQDIAVDVTSIEKQLAELWRAETHDAKKAVTKAALWNVVAHTWTSADHARATEVLARASAAVPQRTIVVQAEPDGDDSMTSWISANCHLIGAGRQVCSEEVSIVASGERTHHVPPLVQALLLPDMPVAVWWLGDLRDEHHGYAETLLEPADRLIVDSSQFNGPADFDLVLRISRQSTTAPADFNWARLEEWRAATAAVFDPTSMRERLKTIRLVRAECGGAPGSFGWASQALLFVAWLSVQTGTTPDFEIVQGSGEVFGLELVELQFEDGSSAIVRRESARGVVIATSDGSSTPIESVTRTLSCDEDALIVRLLKRPEADRVYLRTLELARGLAR